MLVTVTVTFLSLFWRSARLTRSNGCVIAARTVGMLIFLAYLVPPSILFIPLSIMVFKYGLFDPTRR